MVRRLSAGPDVDETIPARFAAGWQPDSRQTPAEWRYDFRAWLASLAAARLTLDDVLPIVHATRLAEVEAGLRPPRVDLSEVDSLVELYPGCYAAPSVVDEARQLMARQERVEAVAARREAAGRPYWEDDEDDVPPWAHTDASAPKPTTAPASRPPQAEDDAEEVTAFNDPAERRTAPCPARASVDVEDARARFQAAGAPCAVCGGVVGYFAAPSNPASFTLTEDGQPAHLYCLSD